MFTVECYQYGPKEWRTYLTEWTTFETQSRIVEWTSHPTHELAEDKANTLRYDLAFLGL